MNNIYKYTMPFYYTAVTRGGCKSILCSYLYVSTFVLIYILLFTSVSMCGRSLLRLFTESLLVVLIYEIGYIVNDHVSVMFESYPRRRGVNLSKRDSLVLCMIRLVLFGVVFSLAKHFCTDLTNNLHLYIGLLFAFTLHNFVPIFFRMFTLPVLRFLKWFIPMAFLICEISLEHRITIYSYAVALMVFHSMSHVYYKCDYILEGQKSRLFIEIGIVGFSIVSTLITHIVLSGKLPLVHSVKFVILVLFYYTAMSLIKLNKALIIRCLWRSNERTSKGQRSLIPDEKMAS